MDIRSFRHFYKVWLSIGFFLLILLFGTLGYILLEGYPFFDALYMTVITLATVGYMEVHELDTAGRIFTIILILANIGTFTYFITQISSYFLDGEFMRTYKSLKMKEAISKLNGHVIICGYGRNGREAARILSNSGKEFVVIEKHHSEGSEKLKYYLEGDATQDELLIEAGITKADAMLVTLPEDADNLLVVLTSRELNAKLKIISRASNDTTVRKLKIAGASNVIMPDKIGGAHMATLVVSPDIKEFVDLMSTHHSAHFSLTEIDCNRTIALEELNAWKRTGATVLGIKRADGEYVLNPLPSTLLRPGNRVIAMGSTEQLQQLISHLSESFN